MVAYITAKLRRDKFDPLLKDLLEKVSMTAGSKNRLIGACVFFTHFYMTQPIKNGKSFFQINNELLNKKPDETVLCLMRKYYEFLGDSTNEG